VETKDVVAQLVDEAGPHQERKDARDPPDADPWPVRDFAGALLRAAAGSTFTK
jgi:hypothetical protein